ncbi:M1 family metallopeptidase [Thioalbus denitrificans]|uniref:Peptidase M1 membrane alanine aminopeptidase domain-containing protein n=1 Tax=Thioalbus denitrificans TaxID=547122 RepID=A0A369CI03_9GAMM|nr:M1 family aminopeptidase [Thioalbus denitrificans]RCX32306.1 hypothetical protein DFQ59_102668 [Thioalbus denitrificans]
MLARFILIIGLALAATPAVALEVVHHDLDVRLEPEAGTLQVRATLSLPDTAGDRVGFLLHAGLDPQPETPGARITQTRLSADGSVATYRLDLPPGVRRITLRYGGSIRHGVTRGNEDVGRERASSRGNIGPEGVFLDGAAAWYPYLPETLQAFTLKVDLPAGWLAVSQGAGPGAETEGKRIRVRWREEQPQDDIYLVAARWTLYRHPGDVAEGQVYLREPDPALAETYLAATEAYLARYSALLGPYPYAKFALVENFWQSGYGMPSFTLLGSQVIRLPFIVHTSYPHEILHNWWGNSVYIDYAHGNWAEGLTTYLADHWLAEERGEGAEYRRTALQRYADSAAGERDFPLAEFHGRHGGSTQAVGYDKGMMLYHMLRLKLGDPVFVAGLRRFYAENRFRTAGFPQLRKAFETVSGQDLSGFFRQWVAESGAPQLVLDRIAAEPAAAGWELRFRLRQAQAGFAYRLDVPYALTLTGEAAPRSGRVEMTGPEATVRLELPGRPLFLAVDPRFDLFRQLAPSERPPALGRVLGAERLLLVLPAAAPEPLRGAYRALAQAWAEGQPQVRIVEDADLQRLPVGSAVFLFGRENRFLPAFRKALTGAALDGEGLRLDERRYPLSSHSLVLTARDGADRVLGWFGSEDPAMVKGLARRVPHYGKYGYLAFGNDDGRNVLKGQWPVTRSVLQVPLAPGAGGASLPPRPPLAIP